MLKPLPIELFLIAAVGFLTSVCATIPVRAASSVSRQVDSFDFADRSLSFGLGVQVWPGEVSTKAVDEMRASSISAVRASLQPRIDDKDLPSRATTPAEFLALIDKQDQSVANRLAKSFSKLLEDNHLELHLIFWDYPKPWQVKSASPTDHRPDMAFIENYANLIVARLQWLRRFDIVPNYIELTNEPHGWWNTLYTPDQYALLLSTTSAAMKANGLAGIGIEGPGTDAKSFDRFLAPLRRSRLTGLLAAYSLHVYDRSPDLAQLDTTSASARSSLDRKPIFITEFNNASPIWSKPPWNNKPLSDSPRDVHASRDFAVSALADAISLLAQRSSTIFYWQLIDRPWEKNSTLGLLDVGENSKPVASAFQFAFDHLRGANVIAPQGDMRNPAVCFDEGIGGRCVMANIGDLPLSFVLKIKVPKAETCVGTVESFSQRASNKASRQSPERSDSGTQGCTYALDLPPRTVARLNIRYGARR